MDDRTGWSCGLPLSDSCELLMQVAIDVENRADALRNAMEVVERELGVSALSADADLRAATWIDRLRANARQMREDAESLRREWPVDAVTP